MLLEPIYEPYFEKLNRSFGFRPNKGTHDAIAALTSYYSSVANKITAIEGDIEGAFPSLNHDILIKMMDKRIKDRKFLNLIKTRLKYEYYDTAEDANIISKLGTQQGGIDSPYLWNIYMHEFDEFVHSDIKSYLDSLNTKLAKPGVETNGTSFKAVRYIKKEYSSYRQDILRELKWQKNLKATLKSELAPDEVSLIRNNLFQNIKRLRFLTHKKNQLQTSDPNKRVVLFLFIRYADDWILLLNCSKEIAQIVKEKIAFFLDSKLALKLSPNKTSITDIRKEPARFLGYQLKHPTKGKLIRTPVKDPASYKRSTIQRQKGSTIVWAAPDTQRLINRYHMKGFCDKNGFPKELPWLYCFEDHVIIERYNAVIRGFVEFY